MLLSDMAEVHQALEVGAVTLHSKITSRVPQTDEQGKQYMQALRNHAGPHADRRMPAQEPQGAVRDVNRLLTKKEIGDVIDEVYRTPARRTRCCSPTRSWRWASATRSRRASASARMT
jgi:DNA-directed RNA polymerase subunit beta'